MPTRHLVLGIALVLATIGGIRHPHAVEQWQPAAGPLATRWAKDVTPDRVLPEYPRPQMVRRDWQNLNGLWDYAIRPRDEAKPQTFDGRILVPFPLESALSGVMKPVGEANRLWYHRTFTVPPAWRGQRVIFHAGAIDWQSTVIVNGREIATHRGGYDEVSADITSALTPSGPQDLVIVVWDPTDAGAQARGKQVSRPSGIWYTAVTGIWQTAWLEPVPATAIAAMTMTPDLDARVLHLTVQATSGDADTTVTAVARDGSREVGRARGPAGSLLSLAIPSPKTWSPDSPFLYDLEISLSRGTRVIDRVGSYFAMRKIALGTDGAGVRRLFLNNTPLFQIGPLDQGWWPDGLYTAPTDEALKSDIEVTRRLGFNMARKHVKVEPERWYYWADRLGLLVWQDMPSISPRAVRTPESMKQFEDELRRLIDGRRNHPSIVMWVPFNEGWGQYDTPRITEWVKTYDPSRLVNNASGWTDSGAGDVNDIHRYPGPGAPKAEKIRAGVLGEFGGLGLPLPGHTWQSQANWSYRGFTSPAALTDAYVDLLSRLHPLIGSPGVAAAVYTQTTDVEIEVNGLLTYDRAIVKPDEARLRAANLALFTPPPIVTPIVPPSRDVPSEWRFTTSSPATDWMSASFDDGSWTSGRGGFGTPATPGAVVGTTWNSADIWLRRSITLPANFSAVRPTLLLHHDDDTEVYINGVLAVKVTGYTTDYDLVTLPPEAAALLRPGTNLLAVHCHQNSGGQFIDVGIVDIGGRPR